jgi:two-component system response regulator NreC
MKKTRILLVDGNEVVRQRLRAILSDRPDWDVCGEAANGLGALIAAASLIPDIVAIELSIPDLDGLEATRLILKHIPKARVLILLTCQTEHSIRDIFASGARGYVVKDDSGADILAALDALRQNKLLLSPEIAEVVLRSYLATPVERRNSDAPPGLLTAREVEVARLLAEAKSNKEVASILKISIKTVETHRARIMHKLGLHSVSELVRYALRNHMAD